MPPAGKATFAFIGSMLLFLAIAEGHPQHLYLGIAWGRILMVALSLGIARAVYKISEE